MAELIVSILHFTENTDTAWNEYRNIPNSMHGYNTAPFAIFLKTFKKKISSVKTSLNASFLYEYNASYEFVAGAFWLQNIVCLYMHGYSNKTKEATKQKQELSVFPSKY